VVLRALIISDSATVLFNLDTGLKSTIAAMIFAIMVFNHYSRVFYATPVAASAVCVLVSIGVAV